MYYIITEYPLDIEMGNEFNKPKSRHSLLPFYNNYKTTIVRYPQRELMESYFNKISINKNEYFNFNKLLFGLKNFGNSCYMNSALQVILRNPLNELVDILEKINCNDEYTMLKLYKALILHASNAKSSEWSNKWVNSFRREISKSYEKYGQYAQEDSVEFYLNFIRMILEEYSLSSKRIEPYFVSAPCVEYQGEYYKEYICRYKSFYENRPGFPNVYEGIFINEYICDKCFYVSLDFEDFISIPLYTNFDTTNLKINLIKLLDNFFNPEKFDTNLRCSNCGKNTIKRMQKSILVFPKIITIILNRTNEMNIKDTREISNEGSRTLSFILTKYKFKYEYYENTNKSINYHLYGTLNHFGSYIGGHYISHCYSDNGWIQFNDSQFKRVNLTEALDGATCLVLFKEIMILDTTF